MNYAYAILETEAKITLQAHGFDPGMGILHTDKRYRGSLAHDPIETVRPFVDGLAIELLASHELARGEVIETREGVCRVRPPLTRELISLAPGLRPALTELARSLTSRLLGQGNTAIPPPARTRSATTVGKGGTQRVITSPDR